MNKVLLILMVLFFTSCSSRHDKKDVVLRFSEIKELNLMIMDSRESLDWRNEPDFVSTKIPNAESIIEELKSELSLTEIEIHKKIDGKENNPGIAYKFGNEKNEMKINYLIFTKDQNSIESFRRHEQFIDCGKSETINLNWAFNTIDLNCLRDQF